MKNTIILKYECLLMMTTKSINFFIEVSEESVLGWVNFYPDYFDDTQDFMENYEADDVMGIFETEPHAKVYVEHEDYLAYIDDYYKKFGDYDTEIKGYDVYPLELLKQKHKINIEVDTNFDLHSDEMVELIQGLAKVVEESDTVSFWEMNWE